MTTLGSLLHELAPRGMLALSDQLMMVTCHHHAVVLDRCVGDALGGEAWGVCHAAAFESSFRLLRSLSQELAIETASGRLNLATELFGAMGHGRLEMDLTAEGGEVRGAGLHHSAGFNAKYGGRVRNRRPIDAFAAGFSAAAASLAYPSDWGVFQADEVECVARGDESCTFQLARRPDPAQPIAGLSRADIDGAPPPPPELTRSATADRATALASELIATLEADDFGQLYAFGSRLAILPWTYVHRVTFDTMHLVERRTPELFQVFNALIRETTQMGAFFLLGGLVRSPEWRNGWADSPDRMAFREQLLGAARALGWGTMFAPDPTPTRLTIASPLTPESAYYNAHHGQTMRPRSPFLQGTALAIHNLVAHVDLDTTELLKEKDYEGLFQRAQPTSVEETMSPLRGDAVSEVIVETA